MSDLMLLSTKNFKQKWLSKKLSHKFVDSFRMKNKIDEQTYRSTLSNIYRIYNIFHVSFLKSYLHRVDDSKTKIIIQTSKLINDIEQWKIKKIMNKIKNRKKIWYKVKWLGWNHIYDQWLSEKRVKTCSKVEVTIWSTDDFAQALSKKSTNITLIAFENAMTMIITSPSYRFRVKYM